MSLLHPTTNCMPLFLPSQKLLKRVTNYHVLFDLRKVVEVYFKKLKAGRFPVCKEQKKQLMDKAALKDDAMKCGFSPTYKSYISLKFFDFRVPEGGSRRTDVCDCREKGNVRNSSSGSSCYCRRRRLPSKKFRVEIALVVLTPTMVQSGRLAAISPWLWRGGMPNPTQESEFSWGSLGALLSLLLQA